MVDRRKTPNIPHPAGRRITDLRAYERPHLTVQALADYLDVSRKTVVKWIQAGVLPAYRFVGEWRIKTAEAVAFEANARFEPPPTSA